MSRRRSAFLTLALLLALAVPGQSAAAEIDITGTYRCEGTNPNGTPYRGIVQIVRNDKTYRVTWEMGDHSTSIGIGIVRDGMLSVSYYTNGNLGVIVYRITKGPQLTGEWTVLGADSHLFPEKLTKVGTAVRHESGGEPNSATARQAVKPGA